MTGRGKKNAGSTRRIKKTTHVTDPEPLDLDNGETDPGIETDLELDPAEDQEIIPEITETDPVELLHGLPFETTDYIYLYRVKENGKLSFAARFYQVPDIAEIAEKYGGGNFKIQLRRKNGRLKKSETFEIEGSPGDLPGISPVETSSDPEKSVLEKMKLYKDLFGGSNNIAGQESMINLMNTAAAGMTQSIASMIDTQRMMIQEMRDNMQDKGWVETAINTAGDVLLEAMKKKNVPATVKKILPARKKEGGNGKGMEPQSVELKDFFSNGQRDNDPDYKKYADRLFTAAPQYVKAIKLIHDDMLVNQMAGAGFVVTNRKWIDGFFHYVRKEYEGVKNAEKNQ